MKFAVVAVSVILLVSVASNVYLYVSLNNRNNELQAQIEELTGHNANFQEQINSQQNIISDLLKENANLQNPLDMKNAPYLVTSLGATDTRTRPMTLIQTLVSSYKAQYIMSGLKPPIIVDLMWLFTEETVLSAVLG